ncbi:MAG: replication initiation protein [Oscillospiraceae bacterium]|jgi:plasmid replication initiation protein|nr:replication initiation protein [Oscillospiraceae bacterium]
MSLTLIKKEYLIEKRNVLNEMRSNNMTLQGQRFFTVYLSKINARDPNSRFVRFSIKEFSAIMGFSGNFNFTHYEKTKDRLLSFIVDRPLSSGRGIESFQLFKKCKLEQDPNGEWFFEIDAHDDALPLMFEFKDYYFTYELWNALRLSSFNQVRMYEILKQHEYKGEAIISLEELRRMLNIALDEYPLWDRFRHRVLESCRTALAEKTDIKYSYEPIRKGRGGKVAGLKFTIEKNTDYVDQISLYEYIDDFCDTKVVESVSLSEQVEKTSPPKLSATDKRKALEEAKKSVFWYYAYEKAKKATHIKVTPEQYARGIVNNWKSAGYESIRDLVESGEISQKDVDNKPSFDLDEFEMQIMEK